MCFMMLAIVNCASHSSEDVNPVAATISADTVATSPGDLSLNVLRPQTFVIVPGAAAGAQDWGRVVQLLHNAGHRAVALTMPGHGNDATPIASLTFQNSVDYVCQVAKLYSDEDAPTRVILVGHSAGGGIITQAAEQCTTYIKRLVFVSAFMPQNSQSALSLSEQYALPFLAYLVVPGDGFAYFAPNTPAQQLFLADGAPNDVTRFLSYGVPEPVVNVATPVSTTAANFGSVPRDFVELTNDQAILPSVQEAMMAAEPVEHLFKIASPHEVMISHAPELAAALAQPYGGTINMTPIPAPGNLFFTPVDAGTD